MKRTSKLIKTMFSVLLLMSLTASFTANAAIVSERAGTSEEIERLKEEAARAKREQAQQRKMEALEKAKAKLEERISEISLPRDDTQRFTVKEIRISGNSLISTEKLFAKMPLIYNTSAKPLTEADSADLYDFRVLHDIILEPGRPRQVSSRTMQALTRYILSVYQKKNYAGIYVYVPKENVINGVQLRDDVLVINVLEAPVTDVTVKTYDENQTPTEKGYLSSSAVMDWSPVKPGQVANQKELDDFVNLLNLNPDRYVSAVVSQGREPSSLAVAYDIYEANPWHWFIQIDNSGTDERQWNPRVGLINTNLLGIDDRFTAIYQAPWDSGIDENYGLFGSYDFPLLGPRLRLNLYGGHSEYDIHPEAGIFDFLGRGTFYGGVLRYNLLQTGGWFFDVKGSLEHTRSKVTPSLFPTILGTDIKFWLWGCGVDLHRSDDMSSSSVMFDWYRSWGGESGGDEFRTARPGSTEDTIDSIFSMYVGTAAHSQYLDPNKVNRVSSTFRWVGSDERLVVAKMTAFGGMYSVRGYDEYEYVADGGLLASFQYEFDLVKLEESKQGLQQQEAQGKTQKPFLRKLAPVVFFDYGRGKIRHPVITEKGHEELMSVGGGTIVELGDNFSGAVYYGHPLTPSVTTSEGKGRVHVGLMVRW